MNSERARVGFIRSTLLVGCLLAPTAISAQDDSLPALHGTLRGWEDDARVRLFDRSGAFHGRLSERGILQRFADQLDPEYAIDLVSFSFSLSEDYDWYTRRTGARWWGGSINHRFLVQRAEIAGTVPLGETWGFDVIFDQEATLQAQRAVVRAGFRKSFADDKVTTFITGWLKADKPEMDFEVGVRLQPGKSDITVAFAVLDAFTNVIYQSLGVSPNIAAQSLEYTTQPITARFAVDVPLGRQFRSELYGLIMLPSRIVATNQPDPAGSFSQGERYAYAGGLLEWAPSPETAVGALGTWVGAELNRMSLDAEPSVDDFDLDEENSQLGVYAMQRIRSRFLLEGRVARVWRLEDRLRPDTSIAQNIDYEDRAWLGRLSAIYRSRSGFRGELGFDFVSRDVIGMDAVPGASQEAIHTRLRFDLGWYFGETAMFVVGTNADLDQDGGGATGWFDGGHARFQVFW